MSHIQDIIRELATQDDVRPVLTMIDSGCTAIQHLTRCSRTSSENANADDNRWMDIETISRSVFDLQLGAVSELLRLSYGHTIAELPPDDPADGELSVWGILMAEREDLRARELLPAWRFPDLLDELDGLCQSSPVVWAHVKRIGQGDKGGTG